MATNDESDWMVMMAVTKRVAADDDNEVDDRMSGCDVNKT